MLRFDAGLYFASSDAIGDRLRVLNVEAEIKPHTIVIDCEGVNLMDSRGSAKIAEVAEAQGIDLRLPG